MGYRLQMSAEFHDWLAELRDRDPSAAILAARALAALAAEGDQLGPPLRTTKEVLKALHSAAQAELFIEQAQAEDDDHHAVAAATTRLDQLTTQIEQEVGWEAPAQGLLELRPGAPADLGLRILFAVEPPGTALLIAVLEGPDAARDHYGEAVLLASGVLRAVRGGQVGEAAAHTYDDARSFLDEFFPNRANESS